VISKRESGDTIKRHEHERIHEAKTRIPKKRKSEDWASKENLANTGISSHTPISTEEGQQKSVTLTRSGTEGPKSEGRYAGGAEGAWK